MSAGGVAIRVSSGPIRRATLERFDRKREDIADTAYSMDCARRSRIDLELAPEPQDLHIDAPIEDICVNSCRLEQMLAGEGPLRRFKKGDQQGIFTFTQPDRSPART